MSGVVRGIVTGGLALVLLVGTVGCLKDSPPFRAGDFSILNLSRVEFLEELPAGQIYQLWAIDVDTVNGEPEITRRHSIARFNWDPRLSRPVDEAGGAMSPRIDDQTENMADWTHVQLTIESTSGAPRPIGQSIVLLSGAVDLMNLDVEMEHPINTSDANFLDVPPFFLKENFYYLLAQSYDRYDFVTYPELGRVPDEFTCNFGANYDGPCPNWVVDTTPCGNIYRSFPPDSIPVQRGVGPSWFDSSTVGFGIWFGEPSVSDKVTQDTLGFRYSFAEGERDFNYQVRVDCPGLSWSTRLDSLQIPRPSEPADTVFESGEMVGFRYFNEEDYEFLEGVLPDTQTVLKLFTDTCVVRIDRPELSYCSHPIPYVDTMYAKDTVVALDSLVIAVADTTILSIDTTITATESTMQVFTRVDTADAPADIDPGRLILDCVTPFYITDVQDSTVVDSSASIDTSYSIVETGELDTLFLQLIDSVIVIDTTIVAKGDDSVACDIEMSEVEDTLTTYDTSFVIIPIRQLLIDTTIDNGDTVIDTTEIVYEDTTVQVDTTVSIETVMLFEASARVVQTDVIFLEERLVSVDTTFAEVERAEILAAIRHNPATLDTMVLWSTVADTLEANADSVRANFRREWDIDTLDFSINISDQLTYDGDTVVVSTLETMPDLVDGWKYEAWVTFNNGLAPLSLGKFTDEEQRDESDRYLSGVTHVNGDGEVIDLDDRNFDVPGEDFLNNLPPGYPSEIDLINGPEALKLFVTVEPEPDFAPDKPFLQLIIFSNYLPKAFQYYGIANRGSEKQPLILRDTRTEPDALNEGHHWPRVVIDLEDSGD